MPQKRRKFADDGWADFVAHHRYTRMLRRAVRRSNDADSPAKIARCKEMLTDLLNKVDTLVF
jgi:hypothetical protein